MKSLVELLELLMLDCMRKSGAPLWRDVETLRARAEHEGDSFITITLPAFCSDFERCLDEGRVVPGLWLSFGKTHSGIPEFLQGLLYRVFGKDGLLLEHPSIDCIRLVRQICLFGKKILRPCSEERLENAIEGYAQCDDEVALTGGGNTLMGVFEEVAELIFDEMPVFRDPLIIEQIMPTHGPGATGEHILGNQKWRFRRWHKRLEKAGFSWWKFGKAQKSGMYWDSDGRLRLSVSVPDLVDPVDERPVRVVFVPKTLKTPRVIAVEPVCMQFAQQGLARLLVRHLERCRLTCGHVNFRDQRVNQELALHASGDGRLATLDMSEASDRVSNWHVHALLDTVPHFEKLVQACRSTSAVLPSGEKLHLDKFASMGSALCFPIEALVFYTSIIASRLHRAGVRPSARSVYSFSRDVYVYGDDLIVPADEAPSICDDLESMGFKVNRRKSFWTGKFRESCGSDCYDNEKVTPVYLRRDLPTSRKDSSGLLSAVSTCNQLHSAGFWRCAAALREAVERLLGPLPEVKVDSPAIGWLHHSEVQPPRRWNKDIQCWEYRCWVSNSPRDGDSIDGDAALAKCFRVIGSDSISPDHLERSSRRYGLTLKRRWVALNN